MTALVIMILLNYPNQPVDIYYLPVEIFSTPDQCDQHLRPALNAEQSKLPQALVRGACVKTDGHGHE